MTFAIVVIVIVLCVAAAFGQYEAKFGARDETRRLRRDLDRRDRR